jgi:hypothetical protein
MKEDEMGTLSDTINLLKDVIRDENCERMNKSGVKGYLGELIVLQKLQDEEFKPEHLENQSGVDIIVNNFSIDVKTSTLKDDGFGTDVWGWALLRKGKKIENDAAICVALDKKLNVAGYFCIYGKNMESFNSSHEWLKNVMCRFQKFPKEPVETSSKKFKEAYQKSEESLRDGHVIEIGSNGLLGSIIRYKDN